MLSSQTTSSDAPRDQYNIAIVTAGNMPKPDVEILELRVKLSEEGFEVKIVPWDAEEHWDGYDLLFIKSTWDYFTRLPDFLLWVDRVQCISNLQNPASVIAWNADKRYLLELEESSVPIIPTDYVVPFSSEVVLRGVLGNYGSRDVVIKPAVSIGAFGAIKCKASSAEAFAHLNALIVTGHALVQPFIESVLSDGEVSLIYFGGLYSHAVRKLPQIGDYRVQDHHGGTVQTHEPELDEYEVAELALSIVPEKTMIARIDLVRINGAPHIIEVELIEPALFLSFHEEAFTNLIEATKNCIRLFPKNS